MSVRFAEGQDTVITLVTIYKQYKIETEFELG